MDDPLDARQPLWRGAGLARFAGLFVLCSLVELVEPVLHLIDLLLRLGYGGFLVFERQFQLIGAKLFRLGSELGAPMIGNLTFQLLDQRFQFGDEDVLLSADSLFMLPRRAFYSQFELLRFKGPDDLGRQTWKLANIERFLHALFYLEQEEKPIKQRSNLVLSHPAAAGATTGFATIRRQSKPSNNASYWARESCMTPSSILGHTKLETSRRL